MEGHAKKTPGYCTRPGRRERERQQRIINNAIAEAMNFIAVEKKEYRLKKTYDRTFWGMRVETGGKFVGVKEKTFKLVYSQPQQYFQPQQLQQAKLTQTRPISLANSSQQAIINQFSQAIYDAHAQGSSTIDLSKYFSEYNLKGNERSTAFVKLGYRVLVTGFLNLHDGGSPIKAVIAFAPSPNWSILPSTPDGHQDTGEDPINGWYLFYNYFYDGSSYPGLLIKGYIPTKSATDRFNKFIWGK